jgi:PAS domain S-box-containing protein
VIVGIKIDNLVVQQVGRGPEWPLALPAFLSPIETPHAILAPPVLISNLPAMVEILSSESIRILSINEDPADRQLVSESLHQDRAFRLVEAATRDEFVAHLERPRLDVVLSDFNIFGYDGLQVLKVIQQRLPKVPVIIVTASGCEEIAVEAMKQGAADYVIKSRGQIGRLPLAIRAAVEQSRLRFERELAQAELTRFFEVSRDLFCVLDPNGRVRRVNPVAVETLGYDSSELKRADPLQFFHPDDRPTAIQQLSRLAGSARVVRFPARCVSKSGDTLWLEWSVIRCPQRNHFFAVARDVTERLSTKEKQPDRAVAQAKFLTLSLREQDVLKLVSQGNPNKSIALKLSLSEKTVERHRSRGMKKLGFGNVPDLVRFMMRVSV